MSKHVTVLGSGSWGMAVGSLLDSTGCGVTLWEHFPRDYERLVKTRSNPDKLKDFQLAESITLSNDLETALADADVVVLAVPSQHLRGVLRRAKVRLGRASAVVNLAKGIEIGSLRRMSEVIHEETGLPFEKIATLSGPSHAEETVKKMPTTVVVASVSDSLTVSLQELFSCGSFRVYKTDDIIGVELGGSLKNIVAIAAGIVDGLGFESNTKGALLTRGLAEITRLGLAAGARAETFAGLSGLGDLVTTCISRHSRNRFVGEQIGRGRRLDDILAKMTMVAEGVETTRSGLALARKHQVEVPITEQVHRVLFEGKAASEAVNDLMERKLRAEIWQ